MIDKFDFHPTYLEKGQSFKMDSALTPSYGSEPETNSNFAKIVIKQRTWGLRHLMCQAT